MPWWTWLLIGWAVVATGCAVWWARALANAETQDAVRRMTEASKTVDRQHKASSAEALRD